MSKASRESIAWSALTSAFSSQRKGDCPQNRGFANAIVAYEDRPTFRPSFRAKVNFKVSEPSDIFEGHSRYFSVWSHGLLSYARKLVTVTSGGVFYLLDPVLERHSFYEFGEVA